MKGLDTFRSAAALAPGWADRPGRQVVKDPRLELDASADQIFAQRLDDAALAAEASAWNERATDPERAARDWAEAWTVLAPDVGETLSDAARRIMALFNKADARLSEEVIRANGLGDELQPLRDQVRDLEAENGRLRRRVERLERRY